MLFHAMMEFCLDLLRSKFWLIGGMVHYYYYYTVINLSLVARGYFTLFHTHRPAENCYLNGIYKHIIWVNRQDIFRRSPAEAKQTHGDRTADSPTDARWTQDSRPTDSRSGACRRTADAKHLCLKAMLHGAILLATCNAILLLRDVKLPNTSLHYTPLMFSEHIENSSLISLINISQE
jgi:hypothetical protein